MSNLLLRKHSGGLQLLKSAGRGYKVLMRLVSNLRS
jgi:hypothetical protein